MTVTTTAAVPTASSARPPLDFLIGVEITVTRDCVDEPDGVRIVRGPSRRNILATSPRGLAATLVDDLSREERDALGHELCGFVTRHCPGPYALERLLNRGLGELVHVDIRVLPVDERERADLAELLGDQANPGPGADLADAYARELEVAWAHNQPGERLPVADLADHGAEGAPAARGRVSAAA